MKVVAALGLLVNGAAAGILQNARSIIWHVRFLFKARWPRTESRRRTTPGLLIWTLVMQLGMSTLACSSWRFRFCAEMTRPSSVHSPKRHCLVAISILLSVESFFFTDCRDVPILDIPGFNVYTQFEIEYDGKTQLSSWILIAPLFKTILYFSHRQAYWSICPVQPQRKHWMVCVLILPRSL
jgi:hypothetical protein